MCDSGRGVEPWPGPGPAKLSQAGAGAWAAQQRRSGDEIVNVAPLTTHITLTLTPAVTQMCENSQLQVAVEVTGDHSASVVDTL